MKMEQTECTETSAYKIQTPGNYPEENIQDTEHGENLKSKRHTVFQSRNRGGKKRRLRQHSSTWDKNMKENLGEMRS
jgi:hypothetical protein